MGMFCGSSRPKEAGYEGYKKQASPEDRQYKLETNVRETDSDIQTSQSQSTLENAYIRYPWDEKVNDKGGNSEKGSVTILIKERQFLIPPKFSKLPRIERWLSMCVYLKFPV